MPHSCCMSSGARFFRVAKLRRLCEPEQVAAVCYRVRGGEVAFLLVQTGAGRWIFPKGGVEPGLSHAQAAAIEAFEEAGVHGRIEEEPFALYRIRTGKARNARKQLVSAHLCEVLRLGPSQEAGRNRTWFPSGEAKRRLQQDRDNEDARELQRVIGRAVTRIKQLQSNARGAANVSVQPAGQPDPLQRVQFESAAAPQQDQVRALYMCYIQRLRGSEIGLPSREFALTARRLSAPAPNTMLENVTAIDAAHGKRKA
jgi:8-oxo-dGTP pyrophosphatase MutT (NUDIX family)